MRRILAAILFTLGVTLAAPHAQMMQAITNDVHHSAGGGYTGPLDVVGSAAVCHSFRACSAAKAAAHANLFDWSCNSGGNTGTVAALSTGDANTTAMVSTCGATGITVTKWYNQGTATFQDFNTIGGSVHKVDLIVSCANGHPCASIADLTTTFMETGGASFSTGAQPFSVSDVAQTVSGTVTHFPILVNNNSGGIEFTNTSSAAYAGNALTSGTTVANGHTRAVETVLNSTSSTIVVNGGSTTTGNAGTGTGTNQLILLNVYITGSGAAQYMEDIIQAGDFTSSVVALTTNQGNYWCGGIGSC